MQKSAKKARSQEMSFFPSPLFDLRANTQLSSDKAETFYDLYNHCTKYFPVITIFEARLRIIIWNMLNKKIFCKKLHGEKLSTIHEIANAEVTSLLQENNSPSVQVFMQTIKMMNTDVLLEHQVQAMMYKINTLLGDRFSNASNAKKISDKIMPPFSERIVENARKEEKPDIVQIARTLYEQIGDAHSKKGRPCQDPISSDQEPIAIRCGRMEL